MSELKREAKKIEPKKSPKRFFEEDEEDNEEGFKEEAEETGFQEEEEDEYRAPSPRGYTITNAKPAPKRRV